MSMRAWRVAVTVVLVGLLAAGVGSCSSGPKPVDGYNSVVAGDQLFEYVQREKPEGYVSFEPLRVLTIYWHGDRPDALNKIADDIRSRGVNVKFVKAKYSAAQMDAAAKEVEASKAEWAAKGFPVLEVRTDSRGSGLHLYVADDADFDAARDFAEDRYDTKVKVFGITEAGL